MVRAALRHLCDVAKNFRLPTQWFSSLTQKRKRSSLGDSKPTARFVAGTLALAAAVVLGVLAYEESKQSALAQWLLGHPPSLEVWRNTLQSERWQHCVDAKTVTPLMRSFPTATAEPGSVWVSEDWNWVRVFGQKERQRDVEAQAFSERAELLQLLKDEMFFCWNCKSPPVRWESLGVGWKGFEAMIQGVANKRQQFFQKHPPAAALPKKHLLLRDPRELRF